jgi:type VI secretion system protein ImpA
LIRSRLFGPLAYRDIEIAEGKAPPLPDIKPLDATALSAAFQDCDLDALAETSRVGVQALAEARGLDQALAARIRPDQMPDLDPLIKLLSSISTVLGGHLAVLRPEETPTTVPGAEEEAAAPARPRANGGGTGEISSRDDVVRALDRICDYYSRNEPSSPVPLLLKRARRLATGSFVDILRDLAPDALAQIEKICGLEQQP